MEIKIIPVAFILIFVVSGCGSGSNDDADDDTCREITSCPSGGTLGGFLEWLSGACTTNTVCSSDPGSSVQSAWESGAREESEPNNTLQEALLVFLDGGTSVSDEGLGLVNISGAISPSDTVDYVGFSTVWDGRVSIYICESPLGSFGCLTSRAYSGDTAYLEILDANGNTIASTATLLGESRHKIVMTFTPMQVYFVRIVKDNLTIGEFEYKLVLINGLTSF
jgi:hypothetical protein